MLDHLANRLSGGAPERTFDSGDSVCARASRTTWRLLCAVALSASLASCGWVLEGAPDAPSTTDAASAADVAEAAARNRTNTTANRNNGGTTTTTTTPTSTTPTSTTPTTTTTTTPTATTPTATTSTGRINALDTIVSDMRLMNDMTLRGYETRTVGWYVGPGYNQMGNDPRTINTADWFKQAYPGFINGNYMRAVLPWVVLFDGVGHAATNTRVQMRNVRAYYKSRSTGQWVSYGLSPGVSGYGTPKSDLFGGSMPEDKRTNADGSVEVKPPSDTNYAWHGWWNLGRVTINPTDIAAMFVTMQARLVVDSAARADDRANARLLIQMGADYYPDQSNGWPGANPAVATSRIKRITNDWQAFNMMTFSNVGIQDPGGGISEAEFRAAPPPLE